MMRGFGWVSRWWHAGRRVSIGVGALSLVLGPVGLAAWGDGYDRVRVPLSSGGAWLASSSQPIVTLVDGASEEVVGSVPVPEAVQGSGLSVVQSGSSAYLANPAQGTVSRVDAATFKPSAPVKFGDGAGSLDVLTGEGAVYVLDGGRRQVSVADPTTLRLRGEPLSLSARPGPGQSVVDSAGRLWLVDRDRGGLIWFDGGKRVHPEVADATSRLVLVQGRPVLADPARGQVGALSSDGTVSDWSCLDVQPTDQVQMLGSAGSPRVFTAVAGAGTLLVSAVDRDDCETSVTVGKPGDRFGPLVESAGFVFVPDWSSGDTVVIDVDAGRVAATFHVGKPGSRLELVAKDSFVFYNDVDGDRAGVIRLEGGQWRLGKSLQKFDPANVRKGILTPADDVTGSALDALVNTPKPTASPRSSSTNSTTQNNAPPPPDASPTQRPSPSDGSTTPANPPPSSPAPGRPHIDRLTASDRTPNLNQTVTFTATESGAGNAATWTWTVVDTDTGRNLGGGPRPVGAKFTWKFTDPGEYRVQLTVTYQGLNAKASVPITVADPCRIVSKSRSVEPVDGAHNVGSVDAALEGCSDAQQVKVTHKSWISVDSEITINPGKNGHLIFGGGEDVPAGLVNNAITLTLPNGSSVSFDLEFRPWPEFDSDVGVYCDGNSGDGQKAVFHVGVRDNHPSTLKVTLEYGNLRRSMKRIGGNHWTVTVAKDDLPASDGGWNVHVINQWNLTLHPDPRGSTEGGCVGRDG